MSGTAPAIAPRLERRKRIAARERWDKRPEFYPADWPDPAKAGNPFPKNTHRPRYGKVVQDLFGRNATLEDMVKAVNSAAKLLPGTNILLLEASISDLARISGNLPYSTAAYTSRLMLARGFVQIYDVEVGGPARPRRPGQRHKSVFRVRSYEEILQAMFEDPNIATPADRGFYVIDGRAISPREFVLWGLDAALAEKMPEVWALNTRAVNPDDPLIKPTRRRPRKPTAAEVEPLLHALHSFQVAVDDDFAGRLITQVWTVAAKMPAQEIARAIAEQMRQEWNATRKRIPQTWFNWTRMKGIGAMWIRERQMQAEAIAAAEELERAEPVHSDDPDPPPVIQIPRKDFPS